MSTLVPVMVMPNAWMRVTKKTSQDRVDSLTSSLKSSLACPKLNKWPSRLQIMMCKYWHKKFSKEEIYVSDKYKKDYTIKVCLKHDFFLLSSWQKAQNFLYSNLMVPSWSMISSCKIWRALSGFFINRIAQMKPES